jgi:hypothetical protein
MGDAPFVRHRDLAVKHQARQPSGRERAERMGEEFGAFPRIAAQKLDGPIGDGEDMNALSPGLPCPGRSSSVPDMILFHQQGIKKSAAITVMISLYVIGPERLYVKASLSTLPRRPHRPVIAGREEIEVSVVRSRQRGYGRAGLHLDLRLDREPGLPARPGLKPR